MVCFTAHFSMVSPWVLHNLVKIQTRAFTQPSLKGLLSQQICEKYHKIIQTFHSSTSLAPEDYIFGEMYWHWIHAHWLWTAGWGWHGFRAGPWHRRNRQMLGALLIHRGAKISKDFCYFLLSILLQCCTFKMLHKKRSSHKNNYWLLSSVRRMIFPCTAALPHTVHQLPDCKRCSVFTYKLSLCTKDEALWCPGKKIK